MITSFNSLLLKNLISFNDNQLIRRKYSILKNNYKSFNFSNYDNEFENAIVLRPYDKNPLSLNNEEYENLLLSNISKIIEEGNANIIDLNDSMLVQNLLNSLQDYKKINWIYLSQKEIRTLEKILGIDTNFNQLFYYLSNYSWLNKKTPNLLIKIQNKYSKELSNLFNFLWTSEITQNNINNTFENLNPVFPNVDDLYPSIMTYSDSSKPLKSDIDFIKNDLIRFNNSTISYLRIDGTYQTIDNLSNIDISIVDEKSWRKFVEENTMSLSDAKILIDNLSEELSNMSIVNFSKNKIDIYKYSYFFTINDQSYLSYSEIYVTTLVFVFIGTFWISIWLFKKSNYKNIEQN